MYFEIDANWKHYTGTKFRLSDPRNKIIFTKINLHKCWLMLQLKMQNAEKSTETNILT